jgi:hypothetical protein
MADKEKSAELILKLYELRREEVMRAARAWFASSFHPTSIGDIRAVVSSERSGYFRMVTSYWDMACSLVNHGGIDEEMFNDANGEHVFVYAKMAPFLEEVRAGGNPRYMMHLEKLVTSIPESEKRIAYMREISKMLAAAASQKSEAEAANA